jgi:hypothetical protein
LKQEEEEEEEEEEEQEQEHTALRYLPPSRRALNTLCI